MGICGSSDVSEHHGSPTSGSGGGGRLGNAQMLAHCVANWDANYPAVTREQLARQRAEFWDTRVEGRAEMWSALRAAAECGDEKTARAIAEASGLTPYDCDQPNALFCYDARGARYDVPMFCLHEPRTLIKAAPAPAPAPATAPAAATLPSAGAPAGAVVVTASGMTITPSAVPQPAVAGGAAAPVDATAATPALAPVPAAAAAAAATAAAPGSGIVIDAVPPASAAAVAGAAAVPMPGQPQPQPQSAPAAAAAVPAPAPALARATSGSSASAVPGTGDVEFKVRLSTGEPDIAVALNGAQTVGDLKAKVAALRPAVAVAKQRVIVAGALLQNATTIADAKIKRNAIVQIMVTL